MLSLLQKISFFIKRPKVVLITGSGRKAAFGAVTKALGSHFKVGSEILLFEADLKNSDEAKEAEFLLKRSSLPILLVTHFGEFHPEKEFFAAELEDVEVAANLAENLPDRAAVILNFDDETVREIKNKQTGIAAKTFGFGARADLRATDLYLTEKINGGTNFKVNYQGNIVPFWLKNLFGKEYIYASLAAAAVGEELGLNFVEVSESLKSYKGIKGKLRLIKGIKNSLILDDSENASPLSMLEALRILKKTESKRKIAVLGDILGIGKYAIEAHEAIGEEAAGSAEILFTLGPRAKFFAAGALRKGLEEKMVFHFDESQAAARKVREELREGDLVLVDGSKELNMGKIVEEIEAM